MAMVTPIPIVSLVPSLTELVWWLGRGDWLIGRTRFCVEPAVIRGGVEALGGTKDPDVERIAALAPELVIANHEENRAEDVGALRAAGLNVWVTNPTGIDSALEMVRQLGETLACAGRAAQLIDETDAELGTGQAQHTRPSVLVPIWWKPLMAMGGTTYGDDLVWQAGGRNVLHAHPRYPEVSREELAALRPDVVLLPDEPYRFRERHIAEFASIAPARLIDGKLMWWYGPRMPAALRTLRAIFDEARG